MAWADGEKHVCACAPDVDEVHLLFNAPPLSPKHSTHTHTHTHTHRQTHTNTHKNIHTYTHTQTQSLFLDGYKWLGVWCLQAVIRKPLGACRGRTKWNGTEQGRTHATKIIVDLPHYILLLFLLHPPTLQQCGGVCLMATTPPFNWPRPPALLSDRKIYREEEL